MRSCNKPDFNKLVASTIIKSTSLLELVDKLQQPGKIDNLQQVCGVFSCLMVDSFRWLSVSNTNVSEVIV